ncbi:ABC-2 family transporter protein [Pirellula sp. SH-Sr6A]|uniref:ABC transporter permease subunit/CPBP intramembrane protease n=1 Tax=Pirellula sp. SH-Sr6A TaxID=1632865 RepID=UPI00078B35E5|nr:ABC transporter permease subunit/CPBP intramembrane protease [Pirellula sp. SH-Sr6A]AMV30716.1 ABC-2 family transporter protein [Pirellula sp. SH-Sr6A]
MNWSHVKLIFEREVRDQLRDRRTMFTIFFLPLLLYPLMGMVLFEVAQFHKQDAVVIGFIQSDDAPSELDRLTQSDAQVFWKRIDADPKLNNLLHDVSLLRKDSDLKVLSQTSKAIEQVLKLHEIDLLIHWGGVADGAKWTDALQVISNQRWDRSVVASNLFQRKFEQVHQDSLRTQLENAGMSPSSLELPKLHWVDVAPAESKRSMIWTKILPFVMLVWALTGAFYPAIDLCAGEKERGTLETLLCSPARRREIVWGKLLTILCFSLGTAILNLLSMYTTASVVMTRFQGAPGNQMISALGPLPLHSLAWLILLVLPISAMFSALALAVASLARSTKEGQYYLMPLLLVGMPLVMLPMIPGVTLAPGTSVIPITGAVLLSRALMDGEYLQAFLHLPTVGIVTVFCTLLATRWAVRQFENESVMFRDGARTSIKSWIRDAWRKRESTPTANESILCGLLILVCLFFGRLSIPTSELHWGGIVQSTLTIQIGMMLAPALIMATILTRSLRQSLRLNAVSFREIVASAALALVLHPTYSVIASIIGHEYKIGEETVELLRQFDYILSAAPFVSVLLVMALLPAVCEELVFRGFIFSGLQRDSGHLRAVLLSAFLFGLSHGVLQQTISASLMGLLLGWIAYRTGGVACTIVFHFVHNSVSMFIATSSSRGEMVPDWMSWAITVDQGAWAYTDMWNTLSVGIAISLIAWIATMRTPNRIRMQNYLSKKPNPVAP